MSEVTLTGPRGSQRPDYEDSGFRTAAWAHPERQTPLHPTLLHAFAAAARLEQQPRLTILPEREGGDVQSKSYFELYHASRRMASALTDMGVGPGDRVQLVLPTSHNFLTAFLGAQLIHAVPVPAYPPNPFRLESSLALISHIAKHSQAKVCVTWDEAKPLLGELAFGTKSIERLAIVEEMDEAKPLVAKFKSREDDLSFIQYTSGSSGRPKGVGLTQRNLVSNIHAMGTRMRISRTDSGVSWLPLYHDMGLIGVLLFSIYWRAPLTLMSPMAFLSDPLRWLRAIAETRATISVAPNFGYALCVKRATAGSMRGLDLSRWRLAITGAEQVNPTTLAEFASTFYDTGFRHDCFLPVYGLAETSLAATFTQPDDPVRHDVVSRSSLASGRAEPADKSCTDAATLVSVGRALTGHQVKIVDEKGKELPERGIGEVVVSGPSVMQGYFRDEQHTDEVIRDGWLHTGDLGYKAHGDLFITGRAKDLIIVNGRNYFAEDIEVCAEAVRGVRGGGCVAFAVYDEVEAKDRVVLICETKLTDDHERMKLERRIRGAVLEVCGLRVANVVLAEPGVVPRTSSGKRKRSQCRENFLRGRLRPERTSKLRVGLAYLRAQIGHLLLRTKRRRR